MPLDRYENPSYSVTIINKVTLLQLHGHTAMNQLEFDRNLGYRYNI